LPAEPSDPSRNTTTPSWVPNLNSPRSQGCRAVSFMTKKHYFRGLEADWQAEGGAADRIEHRRAPAAARLLHQQHARAALATDQHAALAELGNDHHGLGLAQQIGRVEARIVAHLVDHRAGAVDQRLRIGRLRRPRQERRGKHRRAPQPIVPSWSPPIAVGSVAARQWRDRPSTRESPFKLQRPDSVQRRKSAACRGSTCARLTGCG